MSEFKPGDPVWVRAFGRVRPGVVEGQRGSVVVVHVESKDRMSCAPAKLSRRVVAGPAPTLESPPTTERPELVAQPKPKTHRSEAYKDHVRSLPCCVCGLSPRSEASHHGPHGMALKAPDWTCIPLCHDCHRHWHDHGHLPGKPLAVSLLHIIEAQRDTMAAYLEKMDE